MLCNAGWWLVTDVSGQSIGPTSGIKLSLILEDTAWPLKILLDPWIYYLTLEDGTDRLSRNVVNYESALPNNPEEQRSHLNRGGNLKSRKNRSSLTFGSVQMRGRQKSLTPWPQLKKPETSHNTMNNFCVFFMVTTVHEWYQSLYCPTNAHNVKTYSY